MLQASQINIKETSYTHTRKNGNHIFQNSFVFLLNETLIAFYRYSPCKSFTNGTTVTLEKEIVKVTCHVTLQKPKIIYEDTYIILKKMKNEIIKSTEDNWNVLIIGMDTMSRGRARSGMHKAINFLNSRKWLDYKGYQKVNTSYHYQPINVLTAGAQAFLMDNT
jgi:hypothetical protein